MLFPSIVDDKDHLIPRGRVLDAFITSAPSLRIIFGPLGNVAVVVRRGSPIAEQDLGRPDTRSLISGTKAVRTGPYILEWRRDI